MSNLAHSDNEDKPTPIVAKKVPTFIEQRVQALADQYHKGQLSDSEFANKIDALNKLEIASFRTISTKVVDALNTPLAESMPMPPPQVLSAREQVEANLQEQGLLLMQKQQSGEISNADFAIQLYALRARARAWLKQLGIQPRKKRTL